MSASEPSKILTPWATSGLKNAIPANANPATGKAGYDQGFPAINMTAKGAGGVPPFGQDFNGIFFDITKILQYMQAGGHPTYSSALSTAIGGYPLGATLAKTSGIGFWRNMVANNASNPDGGGSGWISDVVGNYAGAAVITASSTTLTSTQAGQAFLFSTASSTCQLPAASSVPGGGTFKIETSAGLTLSVTGGSAFQAGSSSVTSLTMPAGTECTAISTGASWWVFGSATEPMIGVGQAWQDVASSRAANTTYTNTTGRPICVSAHLGSSPLQTTRILVNGVVVARFIAAGSSVSQGAITIVPNGATYRVENEQGGPTVIIWSELR